MIQHPIIKETSNLNIVQFRGFDAYRCVEHGIIDSLPCPWPQCENGLSESVLKYQFLGSGKTEEYKRRVWKSPTGEDYFTWENSDWSIWTNSKKILWAEARRKKLVEITPPEVLYHYTSIDGLMGILSNKSIWLTDYQYLNDMEEIEHGKNIVKNTAKELLESTNDQITKDLLQKWICGLEKIEERIFIASLSSNGDSLSQWRAYGPVAVGFKTVELSLHLNECHVRAVEYSEKTQASLASIFLNHLCQAFPSDSNDEAFEKSRELYERTGRLVELLCFYKNNGFEDEKEYRVVHIEDMNVIGSFNLERPKKRYRSNKSHIIPYITSDGIHPIKGSERPLVASEIVLGPSCDDLLEKGVREFVGELGFSDIEIRRSTIPYRESKT